MLPKILCCVITLSLISINLSLGSLKSNIKPTIGINNKVDSILADLRRSIISKGKDTIHLPSDSDNFTAILFNRTLDGYLWVGDGSVSGLESLHRTGDMKLKTEPLAGQEVVEGNVGLTDLSGKISTEFHLGPFRSHFGANFKITLADLFIVADYIILQQHVELANCSLSELNTLQVHLDGIGLFDSRFYTIIINALTQILEPLITEKLSVVVCNLLETAINGPIENEVYMM